jgi:hypothetical protein
MSGGPYRRGKAPERACMKLIDGPVEGNHPVVTAFRYNFMSLDWRQYCRR